MKFATLIVACACALFLFGAAGVNAKGGSPGFHSFSHQSSCDTFVWTQRHHFVRTTRTCQS
jgi:hypothetical protein